MGVTMCPSPACVIRTEDFMSANGVIICLSRSVRDQDWGFHARKTLSLFVPTPVGDVVNASSLVYHICKIKKYDISGISTLKNIHEFEIQQVISS